MATTTLPLGTLATEFGMSRDVFRRILAEASVGPVDRRGGHPVYRLRDAFRAIQRQQDAASMPAHAKLALARATLAEDELRRRRGELCEVADVRDEMARLAKLFVQTIELIPDTLERECAASAAQLALIERALDRMRVSLYEQVTGGTAPTEAT